MGVTERSTKPASQTLDRGIRLLKVVCAHPEGITLKQLSDELQLHPPIVHRLTETLEYHGLVQRDRQRNIAPAAGLVQLANSVDQSLRTVARPYLQRLADTVQATSHLMVLVSEKQVMAELVVEPRHSQGHIAFSAGHTHDLGRGSGGIAILAGRPAKDDDPPEVREARARGIAITEGQVVPSTIGISSPLRTPATMPEASIGVSLVSPEGIERASLEVLNAARRISEDLTHALQAEGTITSAP